MAGLPTSLPSMIEKHFPSVRFVSDPEFQIRVNSNIKLFKRWLKGEKVEFTNGMTGNLSFGKLRADNNYGHSH